MIALLQRVSHANVVVESEIIAEIQQGLLVLLGIEQSDDESTSQRMIKRILTYRVFSDEDDKMNLSVSDIKGGLLIVPQFTLVADTKKGTRPSFSSAASPEHAKVLFEKTTDYARSFFPDVAMGCFGADMKVSLTNDGPVTFSLKL